MGFYWGLSSEIGIAWFSISSKDGKEFIEFVGLCRTRELLYNLLVLNRLQLSQLPRQKQKQK
jgi:hypothetical protein